MHMLTIGSKYHSKEAEKSFLGSLLQDPTIAEQARSTLGTDDLYYAEHRSIYDAIKDAHDAHPDLAMMDFAQAVGDHLKQIGQLAAVGGVPYLGNDLMLATAAPSAWAYHADIIHKHAVIRRQYILHKEYLTKLDEPGTIEERLAHAETVLQAAPVMGNGHNAIKSSMMDTIEPKDIDWLWPNRIPCGMVSLLVGLPGQGKSFISLDMAARISRGIHWPDGHINKQAEVMIYAFEEDLSVATRPRLDAMGADCSKIHAFESVKLNGIESESIDVHIHLPLIVKYHKDHPNIRLIILDPITSALGAADQNSQAEVRHALTLLANFAAEANVAVLGISHFAKRSDTAAVYKTLGSVSFAAVARSVWCVHREPPQESIPNPPRLFLPVKANYSIEAQGLSFEITNGAVEWAAGDVATCVDEAIRRDKPKKSPTGRDDAVDFVRGMLSSGEEVPATEIYSEASNRGFSDDRIDRASRDCGVKKRRSPLDKKSYWSLKKG
jgi:hypothetical protein